MRATAVRLLNFSSVTTTRRTRACYLYKWLQSRGIETVATPPRHLREQLKIDAKRKKLEAESAQPNASRKDQLDRRLDDWELTVGVEIHAELNTTSKLFSSAPTVSANDNAQPNTKVALFDAAMPGSQPRFQRATLLPALRAALALGCQVQRRSGWDRKHYFHWDQPNGYQITQYYEPFAVNGQLVLGAEDGVPTTDLNGAESLTIGIKQIQMEQDTAKTTHHLPLTYHIDLNRAGHPLIEIITLPQIHSPQTAAAVVRKIQAMLRSVDSCVTGMELGGLRADVNVSVKKRGTAGKSAYAGVSGLGQRTEIKNLSSFAAIENAIVAERDRQIAVLESGGVIEGETRGWTLGATETTRLRGKEGEVDYRYMPDADLPPLFIAQSLVEHLVAKLPELPDESVARVQQEYGLSLKDAKTIVSLDDGDRLEFMEEVVDLMKGRIQPVNFSENNHKIGKMAGNWVLHEIGGLLTISNIEWQHLSITPTGLADVLVNLHQKQITSRTAKQLLLTLHELPSQNDRPSVDQLIEEGNLWLRPLSEEAYITLAEQIMSENPDMVSAVQKKGQKGKTMWFVGQMVRRADEGTVEPEMAKKILEKKLNI